MVNIKVDISIGELLDKLSILEIKKERINDSSKLKEINKEFEILDNLCKENLNDYEKWIEKLKVINVRIWDDVDFLWKIEKGIDLKNSAQDISWKIQKENNERFKIKKDINNFYDSNIKEQKSFNNI